jgi:hypothetical protein
MMEVACTSETSVDNYFTRQYIPEDKSELISTLFILNKNSNTQVAISRVSETFHTSCVPKFCYQSVYCCLIWYFLVRISIAKYFTNSSKRFWYEVMFENGHTFCSWIHHVRICTALRMWFDQRPSNQGDLDSSVTGKVGRETASGLICP